MTCSKLATLLALLLITYGCKSVVEDMNINPNEFTEVPVSLLVNHAVLNMASIAESEPARLSGLWTDQFSGDVRCATRDGYGVNDEDFNGIWTNLFQNGLSPAREAKASAAAVNAEGLEGIATILEGYYAAEAALVFGDVPFLQAEDAVNFPDPVYDGQEFVISSAIDLLRQGSDKTGDLPVGAGNTVLTGTATWSEMASALEARYKLSLRDYPGALAAAEAAFGAPEDEPSIIHSKDNGAKNLFYQFAAEQRNGELYFDESYLFKAISRGPRESRATAKTNDANRLLFYSQRGAGFSVPNVSDDGYFAADHNFPVISYPEVQLIVAETALRTGDEAKAIRALNNARNYWDGLMGTDDYLELEAGDFSNGGELLRAILLEKLVSVFGLPTFYDLVRTRNFVGTDLDGLEEPAQRFLYPAIERSANANYPGLKGLRQRTPINR